MNKSQTSANLSFISIIVLCAALVCGSFLVRMNYSESAENDAKIIEYSYQNEGDDPRRRNRFRKIQIRLKSVTNLFSINTKQMELLIYRTGEITDNELLTGRVFSLTLENLAKLDATVFDRSRCIQVDPISTKLTIFLITKFEGRTAIKALIVDINRQTDRISILGRELSVEDIWTNTLADGSVLDTTTIQLDKGYLRVLTDKLRNEKFK